MLFESKLLWYFKLRLTFLNYNLVKPVLFFTVENCVI